MTCDNLVVTVAAIPPEGAPAQGGKSVHLSLAESHPDLACQWHPILNQHLAPNEVTIGSARKVWWLCEAGPDHVWQTSVKSRTSRGNGCPFCVGRSVSVTNSLATLLPEVASQWHPSLNGDLRPQDVVAGTNKRLWWKCPKGPDHEWQASGSSRLAGNGCPFCAGRSVSVTNSLAALRPDLAAEWHPTRNVGLSPDQVVAGTSRKLWWRCPEGPDHEWQTPGSQRQAGSGCPFCAGQRVSVTNSVASVPELLAQWHSTRNGETTPDSVVAGTNRKLWWRCPKGPDHEWQAAGSQRLNGSGCPFCRGISISSTNCLVTQFPELVSEWHPTRNGSLTPDQVVAGSGTRVWWLCPHGADHEWQSAVNTRTSGKGCPFCAGQRVSTTNSVASVPELLAQWHPIRNGSLTPQQVVAGTNKSLWWLCSNGPDHEWKAPGSRRLAGSGCPFCAGQRVSVTNSVASVPELLDEWHPTRNGETTPDSVVAGTNRKLWWRCPKGPDHEWQAAGSTRLAGMGCPFCAGRAVSVTNSLAALRPDLAREWHPRRNGELRPESLVAGSHKRVWWRCANNPGHEWQTAGSTRLSGHGCPFCSGRGYDPAKAGFIYMLCGAEWGKVGISNVLEKRLAKHARGRTFGDLVVAARFQNGALPALVESALLDFIAARTTERAPRIDGFTESFPASLREDVLREFHRLVGRNPKSEWSVVEASPSRPS